MPPRGLRRWAVGSLIVLVWLGVDRPWTIRPVESLAESEPFDAARYVDEAWATQVIPTLEAAAVPVAQMADRSSGAPAVATAVTAVGLILSVDTSSRAGLAAIDLDPVDGRADALLQVGPVIRGTALRDALGFIRFTDFTNQIEFAAVAGALNGRVLSTVLSPLDVAALGGRRVRILGVAAAGAEPDALPTIVAVRLDVEEQP